MTCVYIKPDVKKNDTTAMSRATNEVCTGWLDRNCNLWGKIDTFDSARCKFIIEDFFGGENE